MKGEGEEKKKKKTNYEEHVGNVNINM
jgi:hypothetical protein